MFSLFSPQCIFDGPHGALRVWIRHRYGVPKVAIAFEDGEEVVWPRSKRNCWTCGSDGHVFLAAPEVSALWGYVADVSDE